VSDANGNGAVTPPTLAITLTETGQVQVSGPIQNLVLCYGLLEAAKDAIRKHSASAPKSGLVMARGTLPRM